MNENMFGLGVLSQGETILSPEQDRLLAKKAWLFLHEYMIRNNELIKANRIPVPWSLDEDKQIERSLKISNQYLDRFRSVENYIKFYKADENKGQYTKENVESQLSFYKNKERTRWLLDSVIADNPLTVLDVGAGYGELAVLLARTGIQVTALNLFEESTKPIRELIREEPLPIEWIVGMFEVIDFKQTKFDVVVCGEVLEHVADDLNFLQKCVNLAKQTVLVTTPYGSDEGGFVPKSDHENSMHVRAYSERSINNLISKLTGIKKNSKVFVKTSVVGYRNQPIRCFCFKLEKEVSENATQSQGIELETVKV